MLVPLKKKNTWNNTDNAFEERKASFPRGKKE